MSSCGLFMRGKMTDCKASERRCFFLLGLVDFGVVYSRMLLIPTSMGNWTSLPPSNRCVFFLV